LKEAVQEIVERKQMPALIPKDKKICQACSFEKAENNPVCPIC
jgi:hypothetical protein